MGADKVRRDQRARRRRGRRGTSLHTRARAWCRPRGHVPAHAARRRGAAWLRRYPSPPQPVWPWIARDRVRSRSWPTVAAMSTICATDHHIGRRSRGSSRGVTSSTATRDHAVPDPSADCCGRCPDIGASSRRSTPWLPMATTTASPLRTTVAKASLTSVDCRAGRLSLAHLLDLALRECERSAPLFVRVPDLDLRSRLYAPAARAVTSAHFGRGDRGGVEELEARRIQRFDLVELPPGSTAVVASRPAAPHIATRDPIGRWFVGDQGEDCAVRRNHEALHRRRTDA